jgi:protein involved in polysaccharide export with SLBB domain
MARYLPGSVDPIRMFVVNGGGILAKRREDVPHVPASKGSFTPSSAGEIGAGAPRYPDFDLQPDDVLLVRSLPENARRRLAEIRGEVSYPGTYPVQEGQTRLTDLIAWAGGLTADASLIEAKVIRQADVGLADREFERLKSVPISDMSKSEYAYFKVKSREVLGAMVVDFRSAISEKASDDNLFLHRGDLVIIPKSRDFVSVLGLVRNPGNVPFEQNLTARDYVERSGGYATDADRGKSRVIKAGGGGWEDLDEAGILGPGDSVFIPQEPDFEFWPLLRDFLIVTTQILTIYLVVDDVTRN